MATKVRRKGQGVRRSTAAQNRAAKARQVRKQGKGLLDGTMALLPFTEDQLHRIFLAIIIGGAVALAWFVANLAGLPAMARTEIAAVASDAGVEVRRVRVSGIHRMNANKVYEAAYGQRDTPMPLVDLEALREELVAMPWVKDARVSRQLPETLAIDIVERTPHAVLAKPGRLVLIDATGHELEPISKANAKGMLRVSGPGAAKQVAYLGELLSAAPALKPQVEAAEWIGNRRWNLTFKTSQVLALPQGDDEAATALINFATLDGKNRLLGGKVVTFDMRVPDKIYMQVPGRGQQVLDSAGDS